MSKPKLYMLPAVDRTGYQAPVLDLKSGDVLLRHQNMQVTMSVLSNGFHVVTFTYMAKLFTDTDYAIFWEVGHRVQFTDAGNFKFVKGFSNAKYGHVLFPELRGIDYVGWQPQDAYWLRFKQYEFIDMLPKKLAENVAS